MNVNVSVMVVVLLVLASHVEEALDCVDLL